MLFVLESHQAFVEADDEQNPDEQSLISFKNALESSHNLVSWNKTNPHCYWVGVSCQRGRVIWLVLPTHSLKGPLSPSLFFLSSLSDLSQNPLFGQLSRQVSNLKRLKQLSLGENQLSDFVPSQLGVLTQLETLSLGSNSFTGEIPSELGKLKNLKTLDLSGNEFNGTVRDKLLPPEIGELSLLEIFSSPSCSITGPLPEELSKLKFLSMLDLSENPLKCSVPKAIGELRKLGILNLGSTQLNGSIPAELGKCENLMSVMLSCNALSGSLPEQLSELPVLIFAAEKN
ncbi:hypothetical protein CISIN_1g041406mg [Citrus sinensis]|uniref:Leucine-rich repeat-containing N-terminal plant-type domain-containing protein n=2 Tax=Citrus sinensis TaxID=2711 RepID=A0A067DQY5_CITSI|nr:hypothetical protein CISIN_1g041406mg [Citrus sinensis]